MKNLNLYYLKGKEFGILIDMNMSDEIKSHRYYFLDDNMNFYRIKSVDTLLSYLDNNDINLMQMNEEETRKLYSLLKKKKNKDNFNSEKNIYPGLKEITEFDNEILNKKFNKRIMKYSEELSKLNNDDKKEK